MRTREIHLNYLLSAVEVPHDRGQAVAAENSEPI